MDKNTLKKARKYEESFLNDRDGTKPLFHMAVPVGWMNDPNGFSEYKGNFHLFFQYYPYDTQWGPMHWGHCKTMDFVKWELLAAALAPEDEYDTSGCYSGSAIEDGEKHVLAYTSVVYKEVNGEYKARQCQCLAIGNGIEYEKLDNNPVITPDMVSQTISKEDFRDPKLWKKDDKYYMIVGCANEQGLGRLGLFVSENLKEWSFANMLAENNGEYGTMWECPDFFELDGRYVLITSPVDMQEKELEFHKGHNVVHFVGDFSYENLKYEYNEPYSIDYGLDFYAPQTMKTSDGRRIMVAWMQTWYSEVLPKGFSWNGSMTLPRELHVKEGKLIQNPIRELEDYFTNEVVYKEKELTGRMALSGVQGRMINLEMEIVSGDYSSFEIQLAKDATGYVSCRLEGDVLTLDRSHTKSNTDVLQQRSMKIKNSENLKLRFVLDKHSVEIFVNEGRYAMTSLFYMPMQAQDIEFIVEGKLLANIKKNDIEVNYE